VRRRPEQLHIVLRDSLLVDGFFEIPTNTNQLIANRLQLTFHH